MIFEHNKLKKVQLKVLSNFPQFFWANIWGAQTNWADHHDEGQNDLKIVLR